ncbi:hypothetical protein FPQ18DRAFT_340857 [Pyronema domesticum]|uniref:Uncharacterized protein n=1 Tax=Pyronema omphalodes (strain CBS 100304) TaxID=1076935 RepID=U4LHU0_PYROM|nr:hypothetical protein FPQ18DRAFT_340857 [Pyronema domesticum]CCX31488.1 Protein of unknown function [Pyronema omphalodes CBS 100304]
MTTRFYNPSYDKQQIIDNCKYLFGDDVDPVVLTEQYDGIVSEQERFWDGRQHSYKSVPKTYTCVRAIVVDRMHTDTSILLATDIDQRALCYSSPTKDAVYLTSTFAWKLSDSQSVAPYAIEELHRLTTNLMKDKLDQEVFLNNKLKEGVEEKLQRLTAETDVDDTIKEGLRQQLYQRARASFKCKEEKRKNEIARKIQDMLDTLEDEDDDEASMDQILLRIQQPSKNTASQNEIDWRGECVSNIVKNCQKKFREKLKQQKEELTKKFEEEIKIAVQEEKGVADQKLAGIQLEHEGVKKTYDETIEGMKQDRAHSDAEKDASIRDLKEELDAKVQALEKACSSVEKEKGFRKKLEDALDVLHQTEMERRQELAEVKAELQRNLLQQHTRSTTTDTENTDCDTVTEGSQYTPTGSTIDGSTTATIYGGE